MQTQGILITLKGIGCRLEPEVEGFILEIASQALRRFRRKLSILHKQKAEDVDSLLFVTSHLFSLKLKNVQKVDRCLPIDI